MPRQKPKKYDVITVGGATRDIMFYSDEGELISTSQLTKKKLLAFEYGAKITADKLFYTFGGGAANVAVSFSKLGMKVASVIRIGQDENGQNALKNLKAHKVDTSFIKIDRKAHTGFSMILTIKNLASEHILFTYRGANDKLCAANLPLSKIDCHWFYVSSLPKVGWDRIMDRLCKGERNIVWNPGSKQLMDIKKVKKFLPKIKIFTVNRDEALEFRKLKNIRGLLKYIGSIGPEIVVITDGQAGAYAYDGKKYYFMKARRSKAMDTVGVGDSFSSAFTTAIIKNKTIREALTWGMKNSASVVSKIGAQNGLLTKRQIMR